MDSDSDSNTDFDYDSYDNDDIKEQITKDLKYIYTYIIEDYKNRYDCPILNKLRDDNKYDFVNYVFDNMDYSKLIQ